MASVFYQCFSCGQYFSTKEDAGNHVSNCSKANVVQTEESAQAEILVASLVPQQLLESLQNPTEEPADAVETAEEKIDEKAVFVWNRAATLLLIKLYQQHEMKFLSGTNKKKQVWLMIAKEVKAAGYRVTTLQCENRWKTLMSSYRKTKFLGQLSGNSDKKTCNFFEEIDALIKSKRHTSTGVIARRLQALEPSSPDKPQRKTRKKRESNGGGDLYEMLKNMEERSEQRHQERMALQREMMESHKYFMENILQMLIEEKTTSSICQN